MADKELTGSLGFENKLWEAADLLRNIARYAGCHIYNEANDVIYANRHFICLHSAQGGSRTINLPKQMNVWDVFAEKQIASSVASFQTDILPGSTVLYYLGEDWLNEYTVK